MAIPRWLRPSGVDSAIGSDLGLENRGAGKFARARRLSVSPVAALMARATATRDYRRTSRNPVSLAPDPAITPEPVIQVYGARCLRWRGYFSLHTWIAIKPAAARDWKIYEVTPEALLRRGCCVATPKRAPDAFWHGTKPRLLAEKRGDDVGVLIERIGKAIREYRYAGKYVMWPGPNSNTFIAHLARAVPELELELPSIAVGKDYLGHRLIGRAPSGSGFQISLFGLLGILVSHVEGIEFNVLGLSCGINPFNLCVKLPLLGHLGVPRNIGPGAHRHALSEATGVIE